MWYWLADLCADEGIPFVLGHALSMNAIHGGKAKHAEIDSQKIAALLRGGMLPKAYVYPADMRATRDLLRRRTRLVRQRSELLAHVHNTNSQENLPEIGKKIASGIHVTRDSLVSVVYAVELYSATGSCTHQRTDRHEIVGQKPADVQPDFDRGYRALH
jgi:transposase